MSQRQRKTTIRFLKADSADKIPNEQIKVLLKIQHKSDFKETSNLATTKKSKKDINLFLHNAEK